MLLALLFLSQQKCFYSMPNSIENDLYERYREIDTVIRQVETDFLIQKWSMQNL